jgi:F0F1-type ATP synthase assembly protein I
MDVAFELLGAILFMSWLGWLAVTYWHWPLIVMVLAPILGMAGAIYSIYKKNSKP